MQTGLCRSTGYVESEGESIYYEVTGTGSPVVLCHGLGGNHASWWRQIEELADRHQVVTWDQRGFGNSTVRSAEVGPPAARRDLHVLLEELDLPVVTLVGQSMGGWTALGYAVEHPERVRALVLSTTLAGARREHVDILVNAEPDRERSNRREHPVLSAEFCRSNPELGVLYNQLSSFGARPSPAAVLQAMAEDSFTAEQLAGVVAPTLVLMAEDDSLCPPHAMREVAETVHDGRLVTIPGGHSAYYEQPKEWNAAVLAFLGAR